MKLTTNNQRRRRQAGLTLPEVMMSLALMGLAISGMINGHLFASRQTMRASVSQEVQLELNTRLAETKAARWDILAYPVIDELVTENFPENVVEMRSRIALDSDNVIVSRVNIATISSDPPLKKVEVLCSWTTTSGTTATSKVTTLRSPDQ